MAYHGFSHSSFSLYSIIKEPLPYVLPRMWTLDQGQTQQGDWILIT
jgi:hypothetical protein